MVPEQHGGTATLVPPYPPSNTNPIVGWNKRSGSTFWMKEVGYDS